MNHSMKKLKRAVTVVVDFLDGIGRRQIWTFAAAATFYLFLSLAPILGLVCSLLPYTPLTEEALLRYISRVAPGEVYSFLESVITSIYDSSVTTLSITAVATVWTAGLSMQALMRGMDAAYDLKRRENFLLFRLRACFFMVIALAAVLLTLCALVYGGMILNLISRSLDGTLAETILLGVVKVIRYPFMMLFLYFVFLVFYKWMPTGKRPLRRQWPGALFATLAWLVFSWGFSIYLDYSDRFGVYGILGAVIVALLWMYYCLFILLVGAYINRFSRDEREKLHPAALPEPEGEAPRIEGKTE